MKSILKLNTLAISMAALCATPMAFAQDTQVDGGFNAGLNFDESVSIQLSNVADVHLIKKSGVWKEVDIKGLIETTGVINVDAAALGIIDDKQITGDNYYLNERVRNDAHISDGAGESASGNIAVNITAGDGNLQDNATALAAADAAHVMGSADAEAFTAQLSGFNVVDQIDIVNSASITGGAFNGAAGVIALNVTAGNNNAQKNNTVAAVSTGVMAEANIWVKQESVSQTTNNVGQVITNSSSSTTTIPDRFGQADPVVVVEDEDTTVNLPVVNNSLLAASLVGASGNIGVNISTGTNNLQNNSLAISATTVDMTNF